MSNMSGSEVPVPEVKALSPIEDEIKVLEHEVADYAKRARGSTIGASLLVFITVGTGYVAVAAEREDLPLSLRAAGLAAFNGALAVAAAIDAVKNHTQAASLEGAITTHELMQTQRETDDQNPEGLQ